MAIQLKYKFKTAPFKAALIYDVYLRTLRSDSDTSWDPNVIMMLVLPKNANQLTDTIFSHIATPVDMLDYPAQYTRGTPYYRANQAILRVGSVLQAHALVKQLNICVKRLNKSLSILQQSDSLSYISADYL